MRQKRAKAYKRLMQTYSLTFGFRQPYQVLVDAEFCQTIAKAQVDVEKMLETVCQGKCKPMITQCSMQALYELGPDGQQVVDLAKRFERRKCNHREPVPGDACLTDVVGPENKHRYVLATQSVPLRNHMRAGVPALPVMHIKRGVTVLEPMSDVSVRRKAQLEQSALAEAKAAALPAPPTSLALDIVGAADPSSTSASASTSAPAGDAPKPKKKGPKGPNPLSQKKKKDAPKAAKPKAKASAGAKKELAPAVGGKRKRPAEDDAAVPPPSQPSTSASTEVKPDVVGAGAGGGAEGEGRKRKKRRRRTGKAGDGSGGESGGDD